MVYHILKDGSRPDDITGRVVEVDANSALYHVIHKINCRGNSATQKPNTYEKKIEV